MNRSPESKKEKVQEIFELLSEIKEILKTGNR